jgi:putative spermidine/putrescine transport system permease protein
MPENRDNRTFDFPRGALACAVGAGCLAPFAYLMVLSLARRWTFPHLRPESFDLAAWRHVFTAGEGLGASLLLSLALSTTVATLSTLAGFITGRTIGYDRHKRLWLSLAYAPFVMSPAILGVCLLYVFLRLGLAGGFAGVVGAQFIFAYAFDVVLFSGFWNAEVRELEELVYTLGGSVAQAYWRALLPVSRGVLLVGFFQSFLISWFDYGLTLILGSGRVQTLTIRVFEYIGAGDLAMAAVSACLLVLPPLALLTLQRRLVLAKVSAGMS